MPFEKSIRTPIIDTVAEYLSKNDISKKEFVKGLQQYLNPEATFNAFYQRHYKLLTGDYKELRPEEEKAYRFWLDVQQTDRHEMGSAIYNFLSTNPDKKITQANKWLSSGIFNPTKARRLTGKLKSAISEIQSLFQY